MITDIISQLTTYNENLQDDVLSNIFRFLDYIYSKIFKGDSNSKNLPNETQYKLLENNLLRLDNSQYQPQCNSAVSRNEMYKFLHHWAKNNEVLAEVSAEFVTNALSKVEQKLFIYDLDYFLSFIFIKTYLYIDII